METKKDLLDNIELRSEQVQEVLETPPGWLIRWGNAVILAVIVLVFTMSYFIKYPEFVPAPIVVTSQNPPEKLQSRTDSKIEKIFISNHQKVKKGDVLMVLQSTANYRDLLELLKLSDSIPQDQLTSFPVDKVSKFKLGDIQADYNAFAKAFQDQKLFTRLRPYAPENVAVERNISAYRSRIINLKHQKKLELAKYGLVQKSYERAQKLFGLKVISAVELENEKIKFLQAQQSLEDLDISLSETEEGISNLSRTKSGAIIDTEKDKINYASQTLQLFEQLRKSLREWEQNYLVVSSTDGIVSFQQYWAESQFIKKGDAILSILPVNQKSLVGRMSVPAGNSGKISPGAKVLIKLDNYRYQEYGIVEGRVQNISFAPDEKGDYYVDVVLPKGLKTSYHKNLPFNRELKGNAEIVTQDLRLIERIFYQIRKLLWYQT